MLMRANKLETALSRDRLACMAPPDMFFSCIREVSPFQRMFI